MSFNQTFTIYNYTSWEMNLQDVGSKNLDGVWPATVPAATTANEPGMVTFTQDAIGEINPIAFYAADSNPAVHATLHFLCAGFDQNLRVMMTLSLGSQRFPIAIWENNSKTTNDEGVFESSPIGAILHISTANGGSSIGSAKFVLGQTTIPS